MAAELPSVSIDAPHDSGPGGTLTTIRQFRLSLGDVTVELSSLGASITKVLLPRERKPDEDDIASGYKDDVVLSYASPKEQFNDKNRPYFGCIVGRVANRIKAGRFSLRQLSCSSSSSGDSSTLESYQLETNNGPNHLHGGTDGFSNRIWDASIVDDSTTVRFSLVSPDGDQGYPAGIEVVASYSLVPTIRRDVDTGDNNNKEGARLRLVMTASLLPGETKATPIGLAQHSYFNLSSHNSSYRLNDHDLHMPNCLSYTPVDSTSIPTREVRRVDVSHDKGMSSKPLEMRLMYSSLNTKSAMDFRTKRDLADVLYRYCVDQVGLPLEEAAMNLALEEGIAHVPEGGGSVGTNLAGNAPYGFDHNYIIESSEEESDDGMRLAASLFHDRTSRSLHVYTTAPGIQVYTANYLDGQSPTPELCKDGATYRQWQGICLETQTFPDSILLDEDELVKNDDVFAKGRCFVLRPGGENYYHAVEYQFTYN